MSKALEINNLQKTYKNGHCALSGISLSVEEGDFFALLGPNGAGKSTTIGIICSLINRSGGNASVFGFDIESQSSQAKACIGLVPQEFNFNIFETVESVLIHQAGYYGVRKKDAMPRINHFLKKLGLEEKRHQEMRFLSGGMKRRLMIARALIHSPKLLILDEPTAGVDIELRRSMWAFLREINEEGITIILTTHYLEEAEMLCRNIGIIDQGRIVANTKMSELLKELETETFVLNLTQPVSKELQNFDYPYSMNDEQTMEVALEKNQNVNDLFLALSKQDIQVDSMRNKANRLEELFLRLTHKEV